MSSHLTVYFIFSFVLRDNLLILLTKGFSSIMYKTITFCQPSVEPPYAITLFVAESELPISFPRTIC